MTSALSNAVGRTEELRSAVHTTIGGLQARFLAGDPAAVRSLAILRRGTSRDTGMDPDAWAITLNALPSELLGRGDAVSWAERAMQAVLGFYALHQQGRSDVGVHRSGVHLGQAVRRLAVARESGSIDDRFRTVLAATSWGGLNHHLRGLVALLRAGDQRGRPIALDYARLAGDLYRWQQPGAAPQVALRWRRSYHEPLRNADGDETTTENEEN